MLDNVCLSERKVMGSVSDFIFDLYWMKCLLACWVYASVGQRLDSFRG